MTHDEIATRGGQFIGTLRGSDEYGFDGTYENWVGRTYLVTLDHPIGDIVCIELTDVLDAFDGKRVSITIEDAPNFPEAPVSRARISLPEEAK